MSFHSSYGGTALGWGGLGGLGKVVIQGAREDSGKH